jgi:uncharacterized pyridoxamine 5'-phosphate oxidase family protein
MFLAKGRPSEDSIRRVGSCMNLKDYLGVCEWKIRSLYLATMDGDQPRVRVFLMWFADESGFYFHTGVAKRVCQQLRRNPKIEICLFKPGGDISTGT